MLVRELMNYPVAVEDRYPIRVGRYLLHPPIARGGMATVHAARLMAVEGVSRLVAAKRLHPHYVDDPEFVAMFLDEARIASRLHHPNAVPVLDVIVGSGEVILVQEYVHGAPLSYLFKLALASGEPVPLPITLNIMSGVLAGLHAAHEATDEAGEPLGIVHRDVSPQNVLVSVDGIPRLADFGIAKARTCTHHTRYGFLKGKLPYMAPEQIRVEPVTRAADVYAAGVLLWELVVNRRFHDGRNDVDFVRAVVSGAMPTPTEALESQGNAMAKRRASVSLLDPIIRRAMSMRPEVRYATAAEMAAALADVARSASALEVSDWVRAAGAPYIDKRQKILTANDESARANRTSDAIRLFDTEMKGSETRMHLSAVRLDPSASERLAPKTLSLAPETFVSQLEQLTFNARSLLPWVLVAGLLCVVALLSGMMITSQTAMAPSRALADGHRASASLLPAKPAVGALVERADQPERSTASVQARTATASSPVAAVHFSTPVRAPAAVPSRVATSPLSAGPRDPLGP